MEWLALKADGTVAGESWNYVPTNLSNIVAISASSGNDHHISLAIKSDGTVVGWGDSFAGVSTPPEDLGPVRNLAAGHVHALAVLDDGGVVAWGFNHLGQTNVPTGLAAVRSAAASWSPPTSSRSATARSRAPAGNTARAAWPRGAAAIQARG